MISHSHSAFAALRHRDFRLLWLGQIVSVTGSQMQFVAINSHVYLLTKSAFALGLVGLFRGVPIIFAIAKSGSLIRRPAPAAAEVRPARLRSVGFSLATIALRPRIIPTPVLRLSCAKPSDSGHDAHLPARTVAVTLLLYLSL